MCFKRFTAKYVVGGADSAPPLDRIGLRTIHFIFFMGGTPSDNLENFDIYFLKIYLLLYFMSDKYPL